MQTLPFKQRPLDWVLVLFFVVNFTFITYVVDLEQLVIDDPTPGKFQDPLWPPRFLIDTVHWWGRNFDPLQWARPAWWRATIWIDVLAFGPFYAFAIYAYVRGRAWIRLPSIMWASVMMTNVTIIMFEEMVGPHATPRPGIVWLANLPWLLFPMLVIWRNWRENPFAPRASRPA